MRLAQEIAQQLQRNEAGLVCAVVQGASTGRVRMVAWMSDDALAETLATGRGVYWSRSRNEMWRKGDTSGHVQRLSLIHISEPTRQAEISYAVFCLKKK